MSCRACPLLRGVLGTRVRSRCRLLPVLRVPSSQLDPRHPLLTLVVEWYFSNPSGIHPPSYLAHLPPNRSKPCLIPCSRPLCLPDPITYLNIHSLSLSLCLGHCHLQEHAYSHPSRIPPGPPPHGCMRRQAPAHCRNTAMPRPDPHHCGGTGERGLQKSCLSLLFRESWLSHCLLVWGCPRVQYMYALDCCLAKYK